MQSQTLWFFFRMSTPSHFLSHEAVRKDHCSIHHFHGKTAEGFGKPAGRFKERKEPAPRMNALLRANTLVCSQHFGHSYEHSRILPTLGKGTDRVWAELRKTNHCYTGRKNRHTLSWQTNMWHLLSSVAFTPRLVFASRGSASFSLGEKNCLKQETVDLGASTV